MRILKITLKITTASVGVLMGSFVFLGGNARAADSVQQWASSMQGYVDQSNKLVDRVSDLTDPDDRRALRSHYASMQRVYIQRPVQAWTNELSTGLAEALKNLKDLAESSEFSNLGFDVSQGGSKVSAQSYFRNCALQDSGLERLSSQVKGYRQDLVAYNDALSKGQANRAIVPDADFDFDGVSSKILSCCRDLSSAVANNNNFNRSQVTRCEALRGALDDKVAGRIGRISPPPSTYVPDVLEYLEPEVAAEVVRSKNSQIRRKIEQASSPDSAEEIMSEVEQVCKDPERRKKKESELGSKQAWAALGKTVKCQVAPFLATMYLDTEWQRMTTAVAGQSNIEGEGWDINCDPKEMAIWDAMRPTDPNVIAQQWGVPQLSNPAWLNDMRNLPPVGAPMPIVVNPDGSITTPYGNIGGRSTDDNIVASNSLASSNRSASRTSASNVRRRIRPTRELSGRGLARTQSVVRGSRQLASQVRRGQNATAAANTMASSVASSRRLAANWNKPKSRALSSGSAVQAGDTARRLTQAKASRSSASQVLSRLRSRRPVNNLEDVEKQNQKERERMLMMARMYAANVDSSVKKGEELRSKIQKLIIDRDGAIDAKMFELQNKPPRKQARMMQDLREEVMAIDRQIAAMKAQYDTAVSGVQQQTSMLQMLAMYGVKSPSFPGKGGAPRPGGLSGTGGALGTTIPANYPSGGPSTTGSALPSVNEVREARAKAVFGWGHFVDWMGGTSAFADVANGNALPNGFKSEQEWARSWEMFLSQLDKYVKGLENEERALAKKAATELMAYRKTQTNQETSEPDTETMLGMYALFDAVQEEASDLVKFSLDSKAGNPLPAVVVEKLKSARVDAEAGIDELDRVALAYRSKLPKTTEENGEVYLGLLSELLLY